MPARIVTLAEAVKAAINDAQIPGCPIARRVLVSRYDIAKEGDYKCDVVFGEDRLFDRVSRSAWNDQPSIDVVIYKKLSAAAGKPSEETANTEGDAVAAVVEAIADRFMALGNVGGYRIVPFGFSPTIVDAWVKNYGVVGSVLSLKFSNP